MGRVRVKRRKQLIRIKHNRQAKLAKLRKQYSEVKFDSEKKKILDKVFKIAPWLSEKEFLASIKLASAQN